jgi:antagonist of KipI
MSLRVLEAGLQTLVVDFGRPASRSLGVPIGGAADRWSLALGNALVGNPPDAAALEITLAGPTLQAEAQIAAIVFGAPFDLATDRQQLQTGKTFTLQSGDILRIRGTAVGMRAYLCVAGGFIAPKALGSRSALAPVEAGQRLACEPAALPARFLDGSIQSSLPTQFPHVIRFLPGAQADWFDSSPFINQTYAVSPASNRMGLRLQGEPLPRPQREMISEPVCPGTVQVTNDGQCIVLGVDGQTIGGYPKIAQVIRADLDSLGQLRPGDAVRFQPVALDEAEAASQERLAELRRWLARIAAATDCPGVVTSVSL